jgi:hypothetical protein
MAINGITIISYFRDPPFEPKPSLKDIAIFLFKQVKRYPHEICPFCKELLLPEDSKVIYYLA